MTAERKDRRSGGAAPGLGDRTREELATLFGRMYAGWDRGVNMEGPDTGFRETPMTPLELEARYVAAEIGANIYEVANAAAFAPIIVYNLIQKYLGPVYAAAPKPQAVAEDAVVEALRKALKPLADIPLSRDEDYDPNGPDMIVAVDMSLQPSHVRAARAALKSTAQG